VNQTVSRLKALTSDPEYQRKVAALERQAEEREQSNMVAALVAELGERYSYANTRLENFELYHAKQSDVVKKVKAFSEGGLILFGPPGTGKDFLLANRLYEAIKAKKTARFVNGPDLYGAWRDGIKDGTRESDLVNQWLAPDVLGISDLLPPNYEPTSWATQQLLRLLDARYRRCRWTWVTLNVKKIEDAATRLTGPVFDRLREEALILECYWPSFRERKKT
jgi:DNA replication protein DnaC